MDNKERMFALVSKWRVSGLTRKEFAKKHNITNSKFNYWCQKLYNEQRKPSTQSQFIELSPNSTPALSSINIQPQIELEFSSGLRIKIY